MKLINALLVAGALAATPVLAQDDEVLKPVVDEAAKINESAAKSQEKINGITDQIDSKLQQFKTLMKEIEGLEVYNTQLRKQINNQEQEMADLNAAIDEVSVVEAQRFNNSNKLCRKPKRAKYTPQIWEMLGNANQK